MPLASMHALRQCEGQQYCKLDSIELISCKIRIVDAQVGTDFIILGVVATTDAGRECRMYSVLS